MFRCRCKIFIEIKQDRRLIRIRGNRGEKECERGGGSLIGGGMIRG